MLNSYGFDLWADDYDKCVSQSVQQQTYPFAGYRDVLNYIYIQIRRRKGKKILDLGFGTALLAQRLYQDGYQIFGVDFSPRMLEIARGGPLQFHETDILHLHGLFYGSIDPDHAGRYRSGQVFISGTEYIPPPAEEVPIQMSSLVGDLNSRKDTMHPVLLAAYAHRRLVDIHPFQDGNGRTARLLMNLSLQFCATAISHRSSRLRGTRTPAMLLLSI